MKMNHGADGSYITSDDLDALANKFEELKAAMIFQKGNLWWEDIIAWSEPCKDLEWLAFNGGGMNIEFQDTLDEEAGPVAEQIWAMRERLV